MKDATSLLFFFLKNMSLPLSFIYARICDKYTVSWRSERFSVHVCCARVCGAETADTALLAGRASPARDELRPFGALRSGTASRRPFVGTNDNIQRQLMTDLRRVSGGREGTNLIPAGSGQVQWSDH